MWSTDPTPVACAIDNANRMTPTRQHELDHADLFDTYIYRYVDHQVGIYDLPDVWRLSLCKHFIRTRYCVYIIAVQ